MTKSGGRLSLFFAYLCQAYRLRLFLTLFIFFCMFCGVRGILARSSAVFQSPADVFSRQQAEQQRLEKIESLRALTSKGMNPSPEREQGALLGGGPCFAIHHIAVEGMHHLKKHSITTVTDPYAGRCLGLFDIQTLMRQLTKLYLEKGYVTARFYSRSGYQKQQNSQIYC
ncbi:POTRA domain-containing protein [Bartonella machadoae]|uniref:POTRA domain-containing protein n=1 Tax=Bartonella machadoae TaxID=2893471 RepID=UPI001F4C68FB|nr:POTRA domain-containing protein [Bartonella machadoae]UNE54622.1 hypothetical protein LNM86_01610 [Bartonella machadoae]